MTAHLYNETHQARNAPPTDYENQLGDAIEKAFGRGIYDLEGLVKEICAAGISTPSGEPFTVENYPSVMAALAAA